MSNLKKTATGPDEIPFWFSKEHAELLIPVISYVWNLSLQFIPRLNLGKERTSVHYLGLTYQRRMVISGESV